jgi:hypothetical protein
MEVEKEGRMHTKYNTVQYNTKLWSENMKGRDCLEDLGLNEMIILEWILEK